jgi:methylthioxylose transferase
VRRALPPLTLAFVAATFAAGLLLDARGESLGTPRPPLLFDVHVQATAYALLAAGLLGAGIVLAPRLSTLAPLPYAAALLALALVLRLAVGAARTGPGGWDAPFDESFEAKNEYLPALPALEDGTRWFLDRFAELVPALPAHAGGHPPGLLLTLHWLGIDTPEAAAALVIGAGALAVPLTYALARALLVEDRARVAGLLAAFAPATTLYGVTSADAAFAAIGAAVAVLLVTRPLAGAAALAVASFFSYALLAIGAWAALVKARGGGVRIVLACAAALVAFYAALHALTGFDPPGVLAATHDLYESSVARLRPYAFWLFGSPAAFLAFLGLPLTWYAAAAAGARNPAALALAAVIVVSAVAGFTKAETERIWLMYVPLACVAAAAVLPARRLPLVLAALAAQTLAVELLFGTVW